MRFADALRRSFRAAILAGPALGVLVGAALLALLVFTGGLYDEFALSGVFTLGLAGMLGLIVGGPVCWLGSALMLRAANSNRRWTSHIAWSGAGVVLGTIVGAIIGLLGGGSESVAHLSGIVGALGAVGGWLCRRLLRRTVGDLDTVDPDVFA